MRFKMPDTSIRRSVFTWLLHIALATIVAGACVTHFFGHQGEVHLRTDKAETIEIQNKESKNKSSAVTLFLWNFQVVADAQGNPVDFISELRLLDRGVESGELKVDEGTIRMNKPLKYHGWRFCQSDYDSDEQGVVLTFNYDPWGIGITYSGYALLLVAMIGFFFQRHSRFRAMLHGLTAQWSRKGVVSLFVSLAVMVVALAIVMTRVVTPKPPLLPVLQTPLLGIHVSVIMLSYTLFAIIAVLGIAGLGSKRISGFCYQLSAILLYPAEFCLTVGIFIGAVWANMSWGRYWGWDPKETWALITMLVYAGLLHWPLLAGKLKIPNDKSRMAYHAGCIIAFFFVIFTYFGVNYVLKGLHSYV